MRANSSFMVAISFSVSALFRSGLILKYSFIQGQFLTPMKARMFHWITRRASLTRKCGGREEHYERTFPIMEPTAFGFSPI
jgi:hypothetical protein